MDRLIRKYTDDFGDVEYQMNQTVKPPYIGDRDIYRKLYEYEEAEATGAIIKLPFIAMVEQHIKNGKFNRKITAHNGKYAVVYADKKKRGTPLIDICQKHYDKDEAEALLKERE